MSHSAQEEFNALNTRTTTAQTHPEDALDNSSNASDSSSDNESSGVHSSDGNDSDIASPRTSSTMPSAVYTLPTTAFAANTGPKGVIADAQSFEKARKRSFRSTLYAFSNNLGFGNGEKRPHGSREKSPSGDSSTDEDDKEFMRKWRTERMNEVQTQGHDNRTRRSSPSKRRYGHVASVGPIGYLDAIEKVSAETIVVVLINDDRSTVSGIVEDALSNIARKHEFTRFVKMSYLDAEMDPISVPAILAYKAGDLIANLVSVIDEIPANRNMSAASLESLLHERKVLT